MASKKEKKWEEEQAAFKQVAQAEPLSLMICVLRNAYNEEAKELEKQLTKAGLTTAERETIYRELNKRRKALEADLETPGAYGRYRAMAETLGLLEVPEKEQATP